MPVSYKKFKLKETPGELVVPILAILFALIIGAIIISACGLDTMTAYRALLKGSLGSKQAIGETIVKATPLIFTALAYALAKRCGLVNLGAEGQLYMGGLVGGLVALYLPLPPAIHIPAIIIAGFIGGGLWGMVAAELKIRFGASEMITTIMLNYIANNIVNYMVQSVIIEEGGDLPQTAKIWSTAVLPKIISGTRINLGFVFALIAIFIYYIFLWKTKPGYETRVVGLNPEAARYAGFNGNLRSRMAMFMAGGMAGIAGIVEIAGVQIRIYPNFSPGYGFDGIAAALLGKNSPIGIFFGSFLFGVLRSGSNQMSIDAGVPVALIYILQATVILFVIGSNYVGRISKKMKIKRIAKEDK